MGRCHIGHKSNKCRRHWFDRSRCNRLYGELHALIAATGGPYQPGADGGAATGGDGGERARKKAEAQAAEEAAKWGR